MRNSTTALPYGRTERSLCGRDDLGDLRNRRIFEMARIGNRHLFAADAADRRVKRPERLFDDAHADFGRQAAAAPAFVDDDRPPSLGDRCHDRRVIERPQAAQIDHLGLDAFGRKRGGSVERLPKRTAIGDERNIAPGTTNGGFVDIDWAGVGGELAGHVVEHDVFENQHRIRVLQSASTACRAHPRESPAPAP